MNKWKLFRLVTVCLASCAALITPLTHQGDPSSGLLSLAITFPFSVFGVLFVIGFQVQNPFTAKQWHRPSWDLNPFNLRQPLQFFHWAANILVISGATLLLRISVSPFAFYSRDFIPLAIGLGSLLGVYLVPHLFKHKFSDSNDIENGFEKGT